MQLTKNFNLKEFNCNDGIEVPKKYLKNDKFLAENLQVLRDYLGLPIHVNSAYRHEYYNASIGGKKNSQHLKAKAADIRVNGLEPKEIYLTIEKLIKRGEMAQGGLGLYSNFVHFDVRLKKARW